MKKIIAKNLDQSIRLDLFVAKKLKISRSAAQKIIKLGATINNKTATPHTPVKNEAVVILKCDKLRPELKPAPKLNLVFEDDQIMVVDKSSGISTHPATLGETGTLTDALVLHAPGIAKVGDSPLRPGIVHRLDKEASGLLVIAKTKPAFKNLKEQFQKHEIKKIYLVLVNGVMPHDSGQIDFAIARSKRSGRMAASAKNSGGKSAISNYQLVQRYKNATLVEVSTVTGRTHQVRTHLFAFGYPVFGDQLYVSKKFPILGRLFLHATHLEFTHPKTKKIMSFDSKLPTELQNIINGL